MQKTFARNYNLGIYIEDNELDEIMDEQEKYASQLGQDQLEYPEIQYTKEIEELDQPPTESISISDYYGSATEPEYTQEPIQISIYLGEYNSGEQVTTKEGYIPLVRQIEDLQRAGESLQKYREELYDGHDIGDDPDPDPLMSPNFDLTDLERLLDRQKRVMKNASDQMAKLLKEKAAIETANSVAKTENTTNTEQDKKTAQKAEKTAQKVDGADS